MRGRRQVAHFGVPQMRKRCIIFAAKVSAGWQLPRHPLPTHSVDRPFSGGADSHTAGTADVLMIRPLPNVPNDWYARLCLMLDCRGTWDPLVPCPFYQNATGRQTCPRCYPTGVCPRCKLRLAGRTAVHGGRSPQRSHEPVHRHPGGHILRVRPCSRRTAVFSGIVVVFLLKDPKPRAIKWPI